MTVISTRHQTCLFQRVRQSSIWLESLIEQGKYALVIIATDVRPVKVLAVEEQLKRKSCRYERLYGLFH